MGGREDLRLCTERRLVRAGPGLRQPEPIFELADDRGVVPVSVRRCAPRAYFDDSDAERKDVAAFRPLLEWVLKWTAPAGELSTRLG